MKYRLSFVFIPARMEHRDFVNRTVQWPCSFHFHVQTASSKHCIGCTVMLALTTRFVFDIDSSVVQGCFVSNSASRITACIRSGSWVMWRKNWQMRLATNQKLCSARGILRCLAKKANRPCGITRRVTPYPATGKEEHEIAIFVDTFISRWFQWLLFAAMLHWPAVLPCANDRHPTTVSRTVVLVLCLAGLPENSWDCGQVAGGRILSRRPQHWQHEHSRPDYRLRALWFSWHVSSGNCLLLFYVVGSDSWSISLGLVIEHKKAKVLSRNTSRRGCRSVRAGNIGEEQALKRRTNTCVLTSQ